MYVQRRRLCSLKGRECALTGANARGAYTQDTFAEVRHRPYPSLSFCVSAVFHCICFLFFFVQENTINSFFSCSFLPCPAGGSLDEGKQGGVMVEFDDGDRGKISLPNIRLLPPGYQIHCGCLL